MSQNTIASGRFCELSRPSQPWLQQIIDLRTIDTPTGQSAPLVENISNEHLFALYSTVRQMDAGWYSVHRVIRFLQANRKYTELNVGLDRRYDAASPLRSIGKRLQGRPSNDRYFRKLSDYEPESWQYFAF